MMRKFWKFLWNLSEWSGIGFHKIGISPAKMFSKAFGYDGTEVDDLGKKLK